MLKNWRSWLARFLPAEMGGIAGSYAGYLLIAHFQGDSLLAAYGAALGENVCYYLIIITRDWFALPNERRSVRSVMTGIVHDFGKAEGLDTFVIRPGLTFAAVAIFGPAIGIAISKFSADAVFYLVAITLWERRKARESGR